MTDQNPKRDENLIPHHPLLTRSLDDLVHQEIYYNISSLIARLQELEPDTFMELFLHYDDTPEAVEDFLTNDPDHGITPDEWADMGFDEREALATDNGFDPELIEVYEYWIISDWLASKLEQEWGEVVVRDYHGLTIWGRTTTGQAISMDAVMQQIHRNLVSSTFIQTANSYMKAMYAIDLYDAGFDDEEILRRSEGEEPTDFVNRIADKYDLKRKR